MPDTSFDPCAVNPCRVTHRTVCVPNGAVASCACDNGYGEVDGGCQKQSVCDPNPCTGAHQTQCSVHDGLPVCGCDPSYGSDGDGGCGSQPVYDCSQQHGDPDDPFEPDECPSLATPITVDGGELDGHWIEPRRDVDWLTFRGQEGHIYSASATSMSVGLSIEIYAADGVTLLGFNHQGWSFIDARFVAPYDGTYYLRAKSFNLTDDGPYSLTLSDVGFDDFPDTFADALPAQVGGGMRGAIQFPSDVDVVKLDLPLGHTYRLSLPMPTSGVHVELIGPDQSTVLHESIDAPIIVHPLIAGPFYVRVSGVTGQLPSYLIDFDDLGIDDFGDSPSESTPIVPSPNLVDFNLERSDDVDVFSVDVEAGALYRVTAPNANVDIVDATGAILAAGGSSEPLNVTFAASGTYYLEFSESYSPPGPRSFVLIDVGMDDHGNDPAHASPIVVGAPPETGQTQVPGDIDVFSFPTIAPHIYQANCQPLDPGESCAILFYDSAGVLLSQAYGNVLGRPSDGGTMYVGVDVFNGAGFGGYTFSVTDLGIDDHGDTDSTATPLSVPTLQTSGDLEYSTDVDVFSIATTVGEDYRFNCTETPTTYCSMSIVDATSNQLPVQQDLNGNLIFEAVTATSFVHVTSSNSNPGTYLYRLDDLGQDDHGNYPSSATPLPGLDASVSGSFEYTYDVDVFSISLSPGNYTATLIGTPASSTVISVLDSTGSGLIANGYPNLPFSVALTGVYYVSLRSMYGAPVGAYQLTVQ